MTSRHATVISEQRRQSILSSLVNLAELNPQKVFEILDRGLVLKCVCMNVNIGKTCSKTFHDLYKIRKIRRFLNINSTKTVGPCICTLTTATHFSFAYLNINSITHHRKFRTRQLELLLNCYKVLPHYACFC